MKETYMMSKEIIISLVLLSIFVVLLIREIYLGKKRRKKEKSIDDELIDPGDS